MKKLPLMNEAPQQQREAMPTASWSKPGSLAEPKFSQTAQAKAQERSNGLSNVFGLIGVLSVIVGILAIIGGMISGTHAIAWCGLGALCQALFLFAFAEILRRLADIAISARISAGRDLNDL